MCSPTARTGAASEVVICEAAKHVVEAREITRVRLSVAGKQVDFSYHPATQRWIGKWRNQLLHPIPYEHRSRREKEVLEWEECARQLRTDSAVAPARFLTLRGVPASSRHPGRGRRYKPLEMNFPVPATLQIDYEREGQLAAVQERARKLVDMRDRGYRIGYPKVSRTASNTIIKIPPKLS